MIKISSMKYRNLQQKLICTGKGNYLLLGFFAHTIAEGGLGSPDPDSLIAETLNSYSAPSVTSFTAYFTSENTWISLWGNKNRQYTYINIYNWLDLLVLFPPTFDRFTDIIQGNPLRCILLPFFQQITNDWYAFVILWWGPGQVDACLRCTLHFWSSRWTREY